MDQPLAGIQAKLDRAEEHFQVLDDAIGSYLDDDPYRFVGEEHTKGDYHHWAIFLEVAEFPPDETWGPIVGDAVHNLRSALDHLAWQLATPTARASTPNRIEFPIFLDDPAKDPEVRRALAKKLKCLRPEAHAVIEAAQPYKTGDSHYPLWLLQRLWNTDKHRTLHTTGFLFGEPSGDLSVGFGFRSWSYGRFQRLGDAENRTPLARGHTYIRGQSTEGRLQRRMDAYENLSFDVALGNVEGGLPSPDYPYEGLPVRGVLRRARELIEVEIVPPLARLV